ncbi:MAG: GNAT family N-acetyltransferase [Verrucomicrobia subdivision 3 bacterium]|nr:GNAT family N-acetyltransferase [Limisphaerales bacterium]
MAMAEAFTFDWDVSPESIAEVRRRTLYPFKPAGAETDAEMAGNPTTVFGAALQAGKPIGCIAVLDEPRHDCPLRVRWLGVDDAVRNRGIGARLVQGTQVYAAARQLGLWADVRVKAIPVYERLGFEPHGDFFELPEIGRHRVMRWWPDGLRP